MPRWVEKRVSAAKAERPAEKVQAVAPAATKVCKQLEGKEVYSRCTMLKVLGAQREPTAKTPSTTSADSVAAASDSEGTAPTVEELGDAAKQAPRSRGISEVSALSAEEIEARASGARPRAWTAPQPPSAGPTTIMLRNIPNQYTREMLCKRLDQTGFKGGFDFLYLPIDRNSERNMGYAFINFRTQQLCTEFSRAFGAVLASECLPGFKSSKVCEVRVADVQGQQANLEKMTSPAFFQHLAEREEWQPVFYDERGGRMALAAMVSKEPVPSRRRGARRSGTGSAGSSPCLGPTPAMMPFIPSAMLSGYMLPGLDIGYGASIDEEEPSEARAEAEAEAEAEGGLRAQAPEFVPGLLGAAKAAEAAASEMAKRHMAAEAAARAAATAQAKKNAGRAAEIRKQIEYYFSVHNICRDLYLRSLMDGGGYVRLEDLVRFPKLRVLSADTYSVATALMNSATVETSQDGGRVRIKSAELREAFPRATMPEAAAKGCTEPKGEGEGEGEGKGKVEAGAGKAAEAAEAAGAA